MVEKNSASQMAALVAFRSLNATENSSAQEKSKNTKELRPELNEDTDVPKRKSIIYNMSPKVAADKSYSLRKSKLVRGPKQNKNGSSIPELTNSMAAQEASNKAMISSALLESPFDDRPKGFKIESAYNSDSVSKKSTRIPVDIANAARKAENVLGTVKKSNSEVPANPSINLPKKVSLRRPNKNTEPQNMIDELRSSINAKSKSSVSMQMSPRNKELLNNIRDSIDKKMISTIPKVHDSDEEVYIGDEVDSEMGNSILEVISNTSRASLDSSIQGKKYDSAPKIDVSDCCLESRSSNEEPHDTTRMNANSFDSLVSSVTDNDNYNLSTIIPSISNSTFQNNGSTPNERASKAKANLRRKPPPEASSFQEGSSTLDFSLDEGLEKGSPKSYDSRSVQMENVPSLNSCAGTEWNLVQDQESDFEALYQRPVIEINKRDVKLPKFPDIDVDSKFKRHNTDNRHSIFKKSLKGFDFSGNLLGEGFSDTDSSVDDTLLSEDDDQDTQISKDSSLSNSLKPNVVNTQALQKTASLIRAAPKKHVELKSTMRDVRKRDKKKMFNEDKPWKNHKDLEYISDNERKRYEGVWASNRGLYIGLHVKELKGVSYASERKDEKVISEHRPSLVAALKSASNFDLEVVTTDMEKLHNLSYCDISTLVSGVVVKRIWERSRLPKDTLRAIWDLVDYRRDGTLNRNEFMVGMWLIDQCLYGRKLPKKVENATWDSLGNIGVNIVVKRKGKK